MLVEVLVDVLELVVVEVEDVLVLVELVEVVVDVLLLVEVLVLVEVNSKYIHADPMRIPILCSLNSVS